MSNPASPVASPPRRGILVILSSPSGAGKTTLARRLLGEFPNMEFSVSYTTRAPRGTEVDGVDYVFVDQAAFDRMVAAGEFAEWARVHGNCYATSIKAVERALVDGRDVLFDIDWQGAEALAETWPDDALKIFILPPDMDTLERRLRRRATDSDDVIRRRLRKAVEEIAHHDEYEHVIVNDDLDRAYQILRAIYLIRRYGETARPDIPYPLDELSEIVRQNQRADGAKHARSLTGWMRS